MVWHSSSPCSPSLGQAVWARCPLAFGAGVRVWGTGTGPLVCVPCGLSCAVGVVGSCPEGGNCPCCEGRLVSGALPFPAAHPGSGYPSPVAHVFWAHMIEV